MSKLVAFQILGRHGPTGEKFAAVRATAAKPTSQVYLTARQEHEHGSTNTSKLHVNTMEIQVHVNERKVYVRVEDY
jgi:hypothetical protein